MVGRRRIVCSVQSVREHKNRHRSNCGDECIHENCLSKQMVKEAIKNAMVGHWTNYDACESIRFELGLEDE